MKDRNYVNMQVNPCKMCMPMGASQAMKGIARSMTIIHGSQGCSTYIRRHMAAHYNEPVDIASSSLSEEGTVYGGSRNLKLGISNMVKMYQPEVVGVLTTCLAETIGDDIEMIVREVRKESGFENVDIIPIATPGYGASETEGYFKAIRMMLEYYAETSDDENADTGNHVNIVVSSATCEDIRELKRLLSDMGVEGIIIPDISDVLEAPYTTTYSKLHQEGTDRESIKKMFTAKGTIELGKLVADQFSPALFLEERFGIPAYRLPVPIGLESSDTFLNTIAEITEVTVPEVIRKERGRLLDCMIDSHKHSALGRVAVFGAMDLVDGVTRLMAENGVKVKTVMTGTQSKKFKESITSLCESFDTQCEVLQDSDFETLREVIAAKDVNLMIGNSNGKFIWEKDGVDLVRIGFPVHDNVGAQRKLLFGYKGAMRFLDEVVNKLLDQKHSSYKSRMFRAYYTESDEEVMTEWQK